MHPNGTRLLPGQRFGRLVVVSEDPIRAGGHIRWLCQCDCGQTKIVAGKNLRQGVVSSCGCVSREASSARLTQQSTTHGLARSSEYRVWSMMRQRCLNPNASKYADYGGRGIAVCREWDDFAAFYRDMGARPSMRHTLDRIDNDRGYEPGNCRWATQSEQLRNTRSSARLTYDGRTLTIVEWAEETGIDQGTLRTRIRDGWPIDRALTEPVHPHVSRA